MTIPLSAGTRLRSQVCNTEVIVVRSGSGTVELTCGGAAMIALGTDPASGVATVAELMAGTALGKRYTAERDATFEVLVTKAGAGTLGDGSDPLVMREAKPLPASD